jgi:hypothetical protein
LDLCKFDLGHAKKFLSPKNVLFLTGLAQCKKEFPTCNYLVFTSIINRIAATLQSQKKLSKKQVNSVNVSSVCKYLQEPDEDMALRLRANLMVGIVRVYRQQTDFLYSDINSVLINFKKAMYDLHSTSGDLNMPREEAT